MQRTLRSILVLLSIATLAVSPAAAWYGCGPCWDYGYYEPCGWGPVYYWSGCGCPACCGCEDVVYPDRGVYEEAPCEMEPSPAAPAQPARPEEMPSTVNRQPTEPAPALPPSMPTPAEPETMPMEEPQATPPQENGLFGPTTPPAEVPPSEDDSLLELPSEEPAAPAEVPSEPAEEPAPPAEEEELLFDFGATEEPATESAPTEEEPSEPSDIDLFGPIPEEPATPAEEETAPPADEEDNLFGDAGEVLRVPGGLASVELRRWVDNTGRYSCRGRLIRMLEGKVQLLKDSGRTTTVPLGRLSQADLEFVHRQASAQRTEAMGQTAQVVPGWSH